MYEAAQWETHKNKNSRENEMDVNGMNEVATTAAAE